MTTMYKKDTYEKDKYEKETARMLLMSINIGLVKLALEDLEKRYGIKTVLTTRVKAPLDHYASFSVCLDPYSVTMLYRKSCYIDQPAYTVPIFGTYVKANTFGKAITHFCTDTSPMSHLFRRGIFDKDLENNDCFLKIRPIFDFKYRYLAQIYERSDWFFDEVNKDLWLVDPQHEPVRASHALSEYCAMLRKAASDCEKYYSVKLHTGHLYGVAKDEIDGTE